MQQIGFPEENGRATCQKKDRNSEDRANRCHRWGSSALRRSFCRRRSHQTTVFRCLDPSRSGRSSRPLIQCTHVPYNSLLFFRARRLVQIHGLLTFARFCCFFITSPLSSELIALLSRLAAVVAASAAAVAQVLESLFDPFLRLYRR